MGTVLIFVQEKTVPKLNPKVKIWFYNMKEIDRGEKELVKQIDKVKQLLK